MKEQRKQLLDSLAAVISTELNLNNSGDITVICTHNSRRSQIMEYWLASLSEGRNINTYSGGTVATKLADNVLEAFNSIGIRNEIVKNGDNPLYKFNNLESKTFFSKEYNDISNPSEDFIAIVVCSSADYDCPIIKGAKHRIYLPYDDPKAFDGTEKSMEEYVKCIELIRDEVKYIMTSIEV